MPQPVNVLDRGSLGDDFVFLHRAACFFVIISDSHGAIHSRVEHRIVAGTEIDQLLLPD